MEGFNEFGSVQNTAAGLWRHVTFLRFKPDVTNEQKVFVVGNATALKNVCIWPTNGILYVYSLDAGFAGSLEGRDQNFEVSLIFTFTSVWDLRYFAGDENTYCVSSPNECDPEYFKFKQLLRPLLYDGPDGQGRFVFDFEVLP